MNGLTALQSPRRIRFWLESLAAHRASVLCFAFLMPSLPSCLNAAAMEGGEMLKCSGLPCIELHVSGGHHLKMLIDTGNVNSTLDKTTAVRLGLALSPVNGSDGKPIPDYALATLRNSWAGNASLGDIKVLVVDLKSDISKGTAPEADGTIAYTALPDKLLVLDYEHRKFAITKAPKEDMPCSNLCGKVSNPTFGVDGPPIVVTTGFTSAGRLV